MSVTATEHPNVTVVKRGYEAFNAGDVATLTEVFEPDLAWLGPPMGKFGSDFHGRDAVLAHFGEIFKESGGTFRSQPRAFAASGDLVFVLNAASGQRAGNSLETDDVIVFELRNGKVKEARHYIREPEKSNEFWK